MEDYSYLLLIEGFAHYRKVCLTLDHAQKERQTATELLFPASRTQLDSLSFVTIKVYSRKAGDQRAWVHTYSFVLPAQCQAACCVRNGPLQLNLSAGRSVDMLTLESLQYETWYPFEKDSFLDVEQSMQAVDVALSSMHNLLQKKEAKLKRDMTRLRIQQLNLKRRRLQLRQLRPLVFQCLHRVVVAKNVLE